MDLFGLSFIGLQTPFEAIQLFIFKLAFPPDSFCGHIKVVPFRPIPTESGALSAARWVGLFTIGVHTSL